ncbi:MAG: hypothetical protein ACOYVF_03550 [Candidatus Zixiibacteriota bacterium]
MSKLIKKIGMPAMLAIAALLCGCIISGTFVITKEIEFSISEDFYFYQIDLTNTSDWKEHSDEIQFVDAVGMVLYITNDSSAATLSMYVDEYSGLGPVPTTLPDPDSITLIIKDFVIPESESIITYAESVNAIQNLETLKTLCETGKFDFYGTSTGHLGQTITVDSGKIVVTFSAGK